MKGKVVPADHRQIAVQMRELLEYARAHDLDLAVEWILDRFPSAARRGAYSQQRVDRILREELGVPDGG